MIRSGARLRTICVIAVLGVAVAGCKSAEKKPKGPEGVVDAEAIEREKNLQRDKFVNALDASPEGLGKSADPR